MSPQHDPSGSGRMRKRILTISAVVASATLVLSGCTGGGEDDPVEKADFELTALTPAPSGDIDKFTWSIHAEPYSLDYIYAFDYPDNQVLSNVCESLIRWNADLTMSPGLATKWENPTPTTWVYTIREGVTFHDGTPMTAADVAASLNRHLIPELGSFWFSAFQNVASIEQTGDFEVTVTTTIPDSQFTQSLVGAPGVVASAAYMEAAGPDYGNSDGGVNCTGPFSLKDWKSGESITLERYDDYWDPELRAKAGEVKFVFLSDPNARDSAFKSGEVDGGWMIPANSIASLQDSGVGEVYFGTHSAVSDLIISDLDGPLGDLRVRQALMMAIDREGLVDAGEKGFATVTDSLTNTAVWGQADQATFDSVFKDVDTYPYDLEAARALIEEAGATGEEIVFVTSPINSTFDVIAQATAAAAESIGLTATIKTVSPSKYTTLFSDPSAREGVDLFYTVWYTSSPDPLEMYSILRTDDFSNYGGWSNAEYDATLTDAVSTFDPSERAKLTAKLQDIAHAELPWLPLYQAPMTLWLGERITGVAPSINMMYFPWAATIGAR